MEAGGLKALATGANASNRALEKASLSAASLEKRLLALRAVSGGVGGGLPLLPIPGQGGGPRTPGGGGGAGGTPGGRGGGRGPGGGWHGGNIHMGPGGVGLGTVGMAAGDWFWPLAASGAAIYGGKALFESAKDLDTEQQRFRLLGMSEPINAQAFKYVRDLHVYGTTQLERMAAFREAQGVGRESGLAGGAALDFAKLATPTLAKLDALGQGLDDESKGALHASNIALLRFVEQSGGLKSANEFTRLSNIGYKLRQSSGGTIDYQKMLGVTQQGGAYTQNMTEQGWSMAEPILQETGGQAYGTGVATAGSRLFNVMSRTPKNLIAEATRLGLWTPGRQKLNEADSKLFKDSFEVFYIQRMMPLYDKFKLSDNDRIRENAILFGRTGGRVANLIEKQIPSIEKSWDAYRKAKSIEGAGADLRKSLSGQELEFTAAWTDFKTQFGQKMLPFFTGILKAGSAILRVLPNVGSNSTPVGAGVNAFVGAARLLAEIKSSPTSYVPSGGFGRMPASVPAQAGDVYLDKQKVGKVFYTGVTQYQAKAASAPPTGGTTFDPRLALTPAGGF